jgi:choline dehydrogenase
MAASSYHYVIVGAGRAGCVPANRLSADRGCRVVLLEAGGPDRAREIRIRWRLPSCCRPDMTGTITRPGSRSWRGRELYWPRGKTLGGSSSIHGQAWTRGHRLDYDGWAESCPGW